MAEEGAGSARTPGAICRPQCCPAGLWREGMGFLAARSTPRTVSPPQTVMVPCCSTGQRWHSSANKWLLIKGQPQLLQTSCLPAPLDQVCGLGPAHSRQITSPLQRAGCSHTRGQTTSMGTACQAGAKAQGDGIKLSCSTASPAPPRGCPAGERDHTMGRTLPPKRVLSFTPCLSPAATSGLSPVRPGAPGTKLSRPVGPGGFYPRAEGCSQGSPSTSPQPGHGSLPMWQLGH